MTDNWATNRMMSPEQFRKTVEALGISRAACGRLLGRSERTINRYASGMTDIPVAEIMLLRGLLETGVAFHVPPWVNTRG